LNRPIGLLFAGGSLCFAIGPFPGFAGLVGAGADAAIFFAGSILFTAAAALQLIQERGWATATQFAGTLFFNLSTYRALGATQANKLIWTPDAFGSVCFLVASALAWRAGHDRIAALNLAGSMAFGVSAVASYVVPSSGDVLALGAANFTTALGALCFFSGALLLLPRRSATPAIR
jgi:hypothetical protein